LIETNDVPIGVAKQGLLWLHIESDDAGTAKRLNPSSVFARFSDFLDRKDEFRLYSLTFQGWN
jgi:hypothetical protein